MQSCSDQHCNTVYFNFQVHVPLLVRSFSLHSPDDSRLQVKTDRTCVNFSRIVEGISFDRPAFPAAATHAENGLSNKLQALVLSDHCSTNVRATQRAIPHIIITFHAQFDQRGFLFENTCSSCSVFPRILGELQTSTLH